jgi:hypothetical protein
MSSSTPGKGYHLEEVTRVYGGAVVTGDLPACGLSAVVVMVCGSRALQTRLE